MLAQLIAWRLARGLKPCAAETGSYCTARERLPEEMGCDQVYFQVGYLFLLADDMRADSIARADAARHVGGGDPVFRGPGRQNAEKFVKDDPYVKNGLVRSWKIREWVTIVWE